MTTKVKELKRIARGNLTGRYRIPMAALVLTDLILTVLEMAFSYAIGDPVTHQQMVITYLVDFLILLLSQVFSAGSTAIHLNLARGRDVSTGMIFFGFRDHPDRYILGGLLSMVCMVVPVLPFGAAFTWFYYFDYSVRGLLILVAASLVSLVLVLWVELNLYLVFYLLVDDPMCSVTGAFRRSGQMMKGNRLRLFYLFLSFIGMYLLSALSLGIGLLWVSPYMSQTATCFYLDLLPPEEAPSSEGFDQYA